MVRPFSGARSALALLLGIFCIPALVSADAPEPTTAQWHDDLTFLYQQMQAHHMNLYHTTPKARFDASFDALQARLATLNDDQVVVEFARFAALTGDGHSGILDLPSGNTYYPLRLHYFSDGLVVESTLAANASLLGARLVGIDDTPVAKLFTLDAEMIGHDPGNLGLVQRFGPPLMVSSTVLHGLGVTPDAQSATFHFEKDGKYIDVLLHPQVPFMPLMGYAPSPGWMTLASGAPLWLKDTGSNWATYLPQHRTEYVAFNHVLDGPNQTLAAFFETVFASIDANHPDKLVIDARLNNGGNNTLLAPVLAGIRARPAIAAKGHLFVVIGPFTYSAAQNFVDRLQLVAQPTFAGEPTGENVDMYGDPFVFALPNSGIHFGMATRYWRDLPENQVATKPDIPVTMSSADYAGGRDPILEAIWR
jgi:hypothetical protein